LGSVEAGFGGMEEAPERMLFVSLSFRCTLALGLAAWASALRLVLVAADSLPAGVLRADCLLPNGPAISFGLSGFGEVGGEGATLISRNN
jgi:hypothetical protein